jgi:hypothetical protein
VAELAWEIAKTDIPAMKAVVERELGYELE